MADRTGADDGARSLLDQAAADASISTTRARAVDPIPGDATLEPVLETNESDKGVNVPAAAAGAEDGRTTVAPVAGARRRLSPRPVPVSRRRRPPAAAVTNEQRTPAEEMDDVGTQDEKAGPDPVARTSGTGAAADTGAAGAAGAGVASAGVSGAGASGGGSGTTTATKTVRPKTAAEIVAEQRAREKAAENATSDAAGSEDAAPDAQPGASPGGSAPKDATAAPTGASSASGTGASTTAAGKPTGAAGNKKATGRSVSGSAAGKGKQALSSVGSGVRKLRNLIASLIWLVAVLAAAVLALGALFTALDQTNQSNEIVRWILERGNELVGPFKDLFRLETAKNTLLVNWGIAALVYLIAGKILERIVRP
ncbi:hypothetical protein [Kribbella sp. NPDC048915]|uniref:hypothetical protein n=1 Tax=Kribbella sp. NPDC048915 TaxID=3155148 RepID=UPI0033D76E9E